MMRIVGLRGPDGRRRAGAIDASGGVWDIGRALGDEALADLHATYADLPAVLERLGDLTADEGLVGREGAVALDVPVPSNAGVFCAAANYRDHMLAMAEKLGIEPEPDPRNLGVDPYHFQKAGRQCLVPNGASVALPAHAENVDWEIELAAIIGRPARNISNEAALSHVSAYTIANDLSARDRTLMKRANVPDGSLFRTDFIGMKSWDGSCPIGPWAIPSRGVEDVQAMPLRLYVNDTIRQDGNTASMIFSVAEQIAFLSERLTLMPGDVVLTGTPAGTGAESDTFLRAGDRVRCEIDGIGALETTMT